MWGFNADRASAEFLAREPDYGEFDWLDTYAMVYSRCKPELTPQQVLQAAHEAYVRESWSNPKVSAGLDALLGPPETGAVRRACGPER